MKRTCLSRTLSVLNVTKKKKEEPVSIINYSCHPFIWQLVEYSVHQILQQRISKTTYMSGSTTQRKQKQLAVVNNNIGRKGEVWWSTFRRKQSFDLMTKNQDSTQTDWTFIQMSENKCRPKRNSEAFLSK